jgi:hypothetical protein
MILVAGLATVTRFEVSSNVGIHARLQTLQQTLFGLVDTVMTG